MSRMASTMNDENLSERVVSAIATRTGDDIIDMPPLYGTIDPDALDALARSLSKNDTAGRIEFCYHGYRITARGDGSVEVRERE